MTFRSIFFGLFAAVVIAAFCFFNDCVIRQGALIDNLMPTIVYGSLVFFLLLANPLLRRLRQSWVFSGRELAVVCAIALIAGGVPSWGLWQIMPSIIMLPNHDAKVKPGWTNERVIELPPKQMLPDVSQQEDTVLTGYVVGMGQGKQHIRVDQVPWFAWTRTLAFWIPLGLSITLGLLGLAVVFHKQWAHHEQLPYPIQTFTHALLPGEGEGHGEVFRSRMFWIGAGLIFCIQFNNYLCRWLPQFLIPVKTYLDFTGLAPLFPNLTLGGGWLLLRPSLIFSVIGLAYFLASDISFSMGFMPFVVCTVMGMLASYGISLQGGNHMSIKPESYLFCGGYFGILLMLLYSGRHYYWNTLRRGVGLKTAEPIDSHVVWSMRLFLVGTVLFTAQLVLVGLDWQLAVLYTLIALMVWIVVSRTIAETGAFHIGSQIFPCAIIWGLFGSTALGPQMLVIMFLVSAVLLAAPGWAPMPFAVQAFKLVDVSGESVAKLSRWALLTLVLCTVICIPVTLYWQYDVGGMQTSLGWPRMLSTFTFENMVMIKQQLTAQGTLEISENLHGWQRFTHMAPNWPCVTAFLVALALALGIGICRLRFAWWPLHPVMFVFLGGYQACLMGGSFLIGWLIKTLVSKYGGGRLYNNLKPLMIGIIAGDVAARLIPMLVGIVYYAITGKSP
ncbi:MAG: hypothetical protein A3K19_00705 [Lentisphaerae bacterium RIFOXYB12_FULL_65_16]|nr:MAG: hypothetical protein A3K18_14805 [Lentisphaerae bacterium RIFOXYA12_64_32]OGV86808.1 MAG: hypothetical protein A3K19_00705 [Lentisphaerae bacterium RIFOXYB12_FULL_65_16]